MMFDTTPAYYTTQNVAEIEDFDKDDYGNTWYNVKFQGNAETFMWLAKEAPHEDKKYYGHFEKTKSGKRMRFKRDKEPEDGQKSAGSYKPKDEKQVTKNMAWKNLLQYYDVPTLNPGTKQWEQFWGAVDMHTDMLLGNPVKPATEPEKASEKPDPEWDEMDIPDEWKHD